MRAARDVHHLGLLQVAGDRVGHEPLVVRLPGGLDLGLAAGPRRLGLGQDPRVRGGQVRVPEPGTGGGRRAAGQVDLGRTRPVLTEGVGDPGDRRARGAQYRVAVPGVADRVLHHVPGPEPAVPRQQQHPGPERRGHAGGQQARAGHQVQAQVAEDVQRGRGRRRALPAQHERLAAGGVVADHRHLAARAVQVRLHHLQHEAGGHRRVECVAPLLQHRHAGRRGQPVRGGHHAECASQLRPGGERRSAGHVRLRKVGEPSPFRDMRSPRPAATTAPEPASYQSHGLGHTGTGRTQ